MEKEFMFGQIKIIMMVNSMKVASTEEASGNLQSENISKETTKTIKKTAVVNISGIMAVFTKDNSKTMLSIYLIT